MANNVTIKDGTGTSVILSSTDVGSGTEAMNHRVCDSTASNFLPTGDAVARKIFVTITDGTGTAAFDNSNTTPKVSAYGKGTAAGDTAIPSMDVAGHAGFMKITDGTNAIGVQQFHSSDNQALGTFYGLATGGITQILNVNGNLDRSRGYQGDQLPGTGLPIDVSMTCQVLPPTFSTGTVTAGATKTILIPSTVGIKVGSLVQIELQTSAVVEWARVNTVTSNTSIVVDNLANGHTTPFPVFPVQFNTPRDASGEQDLANGLGATLAVDYNFDGSVYQRARNAFGLGVYSDTSASNVSAGNNVTITVVGTPPTLASGQTIPVLIIDSANSKQELAICIATAAHTMTFQTLANAYNGSVTALQVRSPIQSLLTAPVNFNGWGLAADLAVLYSGLDANSVAQYSVEKDVNGAGLTPTQGNANAAGMDADVDYAIFRVFASLPALTDKQMTPLQCDVQGNLRVAVNPMGVPIYGSANGGAQANTVTLTIPSAKMGYLDGFDIDGLGATAGSAVLVTVAGLLGGTLTYAVPVVAGVTTPNPNFSKRFNPPLQCSAAATNIVVTVASFGSGNTAASTNVYGHYI